MTLADGSFGMEGASPPLSPEELDREARAEVRILVVDDEHTLRETCRSFLDAQGYAVEVSGKGGPRPRKYFQASNSTLS